MGQTYRMALIICMTMVGVTGKASALDTDKVLHPTAHAAGSYALTHVGEVVCRQITKLDKPICSVISGTMALGVGAAIEASQEQSGGTWKKGILYDASGVGLAIGVIHLDF